MCLYPNHFRIAHICSFQRATAASEAGSVSGSKGPFPRLYAHLAYGASTDIFKEKFVTRLVVWPISLSPDFLESRPIFCIPPACCIMHISLPDYEGSVLVTTLPRLPVKCSSFTWSKLSHNEVVRGQFPSSQPFVKRKF